MDLRTVSVALGTLLFLQTQTVHAAGIVPTSARRIPGLRVSARDLPVIPAACQADCSPFGPFLTGESCSVTECCSTVFQAGYFECFKCVGVATNATDFSVAQEYVDVVTTSCIAEGFPLPVLTFPGQNPDRTLVSALPPGASTIPVFPAETGSGSGAVSAGASSVSGSNIVSSASGASQSATPASGSNSGSGSGSAPAQSTVTAPPSISQTFSNPFPSSIVPSSSSTAPPNAGVRIRSDPYTPVVGLGFAALLALLV